MAPMSCPHCDGTRWCRVSDGGVVRVERCACWRTEAAQTLLKAAKIPARYERCDLNTFVTYDNDGLLRAVDRARRFVEDNPVAGKLEKGLLLVGPPGIGKTHIAVAVLRQMVLEKRVRGLYYDTRGLLNAIRSSYDPVTRTSAAEVLRPVIEAELLVLDDLGAERLTDWVDETMNFIVNTRYNDGRLTVFTTNYEDLQDDERLDSLKARVGFRMHSRLREMCEFLEYDGADYRDFEYRPESKDLAHAWQEKKKARAKEEARGKLPARASARAKAGLRAGDAELRWPGGRTGT